MFTIREWKIIGLLIIIFAIIFSVYIYASKKTEQNTAINTSQQQTAQITKQREDLIKQLHASPMSASMRQIFNYIGATTTKAQEKILERPPFIKVSDSLTPDVFKGKFIPINGSAINGVGAQLYLIFPQSPNFVYRAAFQLTNSTTTPLVLTTFEKSDDTKDSINSFLNSIQDKINDPEYSN